MELWTTLPNESLIHIGSIIPFPISPRVNTRLDKQSHPAHIEAILILFSKLNSLLKRIFSF